MTESIFVKGIFADSRVDYKLLVLLIAIVLLAITITIWNQGITTKILILMMAAISIYIVQINVLQIILTAALLGVIFPDSYISIFNYTFGFAIIGAFLLILLKVLFQHEHFQYHKQLSILMAIYVLFALNTVISAVFNSSLGGEAIAETARNLLYAVLIAVSYHLIRDLIVIRKIFGTVIIIAIAVSIYSYKILFGIGLKAFLVYGITVLHGVFGGMANSGSAAAVITDAMPIPLAYLMFGTNLKKKRLYFVLFVFFFIIWFLWNSRSNYVFLFFAALSILAFHDKRKKYFAIILAGLAISVILLLTGFIPILNDILRLERGMTYREDVWQAALRMYGESPILGKGPEYFSAHYFIYLDPGIGRKVISSLYNVSPHNVLLMRAVNLGIGAVLAQLILWIFPLIVFARNAKKVKNSDYYYLYLASGAIWIGLICRSLFDTGGNTIGLIMLPIMFKIPKLIKETMA